MTATPRAGGPSSRFVAVVAVAAGAGLALLATGRTWVTVSIPGAVGSSSVAADWRLTTPGAVAVALLALAGAVVVATAGPVVRTGVAALLLVAGIGVAALSVPVWQSPRDAADPAVTKVTGTVGRSVGTARTTVWPGVSALGGLLIFVGGATALTRGRRWAGPSRRFERAPALSGAGGGRPEPGVDVAAKGDRDPATNRGPAERVRAGSERDRRMDDWDSLSRGEDPTDAGPDTGPEPESGPGPGPEPGTGAGTATKRT